MNPDPWDDDDVYHYISERLKLQDHRIMTDDDDDDVYYYISSERLKLKGETENVGVCTKERKSITAEVLMATPCTNLSPTLGLKCGFGSLGRGGFHPVRHCRNHIRDWLESTQSETVETTFQSERGLGPRMKIPNSRNRR